MDGTSLVHEVLHSIKTKKIPGMMVKLDIAKEYDKINWNFMREMRKSFGFRDRWIEWVMNLISMTFFSSLINDVPSAAIKPTRGIRQGYPLSTFLFIIMAKGLGRSIKAMRSNH